MDGGWESYKAKVREEQAGVERLLRALHAYSSAEFLDEIQDELKARLDRLDDLSVRMSELSRGSTQRQAQVLRTKEMTMTARNEANRVARANLEASARTMLFGKKRSSGDSESNLLRERAALVSSNTMADEALSRAFNAHSMIRDQTARFVATTEKLGGIVSKIPLVDSLISKIRSVKFRQKMILSLVIASCLFTILWLKILR